MQYILNDVFQIHTNCEIQDYQLLIFDRWGNRVFGTTDINQGWDGTHKGKGLNPGVFVYYVRTTFIDGSVGELKGNVTLIK